jgi:hypothetical protein
MMWTIVIGIIGFILIRFFLSLSKDNDDLQGQTLLQKFEVIVSMLNEVAFEGKGKVTTLDKREFNLYEDGQNQIIKFQYGTGHLTIIWKYKYFQKEVVLTRQFDNVRNLSIFEQQKIGEIMISEIEKAVIKHKNNILGLENNFSSSSLPATEKKINKNSNLAIDIFSEKQRGAIIGMLKLISNINGQIPNNRLKFIEMISENLKIDLEDSSFFLLKNGSQLHILSELINLNKDQERYLIITINRMISEGVPTDSEHKAALMLCHKIGITPQRYFNVIQILSFFKQ